jgi:dihydrolipoamide dehydrogenase
MPATPSHVVILGGGPGGYEAGLVAAQLGAEVTLVDSDGVGGSAVLTDCVPSKTLIATAELMTDVEGARELGVSLGDSTHSAAPVAVDLARVNARVKQLARDQSDDIGRRLEKEGVRVLQGRGRLDGPDGVRVTTAGGKERLAADAVLLPAPRRRRSPTASGSSPGSRCTTSPSCPST